MMEDEIKLIADSIDLIHNKSCDEYAEDVLSMLPGSVYVSYFFVGESGALLNFQNMLEGELYVYHVVASVDVEEVEYVIDVTADERVMCKEDYRNLLLNINKRLEGTLYEIDGDISSFVLQLNPFGDKLLNECKSKRFGCKIIPLQASCAVIFDYMEIF